MKKKLFFGTNLKMYKNIRETTEYVRLLQSLTEEISREEMELFVIPSYTSLSSAASSIDKQYITLGAQNMCWKENGQFTGEISPLMLKEMDINLIMIGHSERRHVFGETDPIENQKVKCALEHNMTALLCIGETLEEKDYGISVEVLRTQLKIGLHDIPVAGLSNIWIAYEPVWAIGANGIPASAEYAEEKHLAIKKCLIELFGEAARDIPVLYGGSVNPGNAGELIRKPSIDGLFTGRSAWEAHAFNKLIRNTMQAYKSSGSFGSLPA
ncbi:triose-phosphate isomerase [Clostridium sp. Marseille-P2415]|uniref:triose-phosphate isomerase n=1 Tax=Clostridium sp. Marseille-P2415 TaxID=1805471 RepID=UPI0009887558|nr:triose-phosphate isomerase [Clostridium sp. Marseille-P2415]